MFESPYKDAKASLISDMIAEMAIKLRGTLCTALIDQDRFIGGDPVGYGCSSSAVTVHWKNGFGWRLCAQCAVMLAEEPHRVTLPWWRGEPGNG